VTVLAPTGRPARLAFVMAAALCAGVASGAAAPDPRAPPPPGAVSVIYDRDYPFIHYSEPPEQNEVARLQKRLSGDSVKLVATAQHGYLESVLAALAIDPDSQLLVFSKTSLQIDVISAATPRAVYFNDDTYVAWVQQSGVLEIVTMDADRGPVFYTLSASDPSAQLARETLRCLTCHDTFAEMGGGVPHFLFESTYDVADGNLLPDAVARETTDETPIAQRWGGWYVTGKDGGAFNLGNIQPPATRAPVSIDKARRGSLSSLASLLDTTPYLRSTSDIVALLILEHQVTVHNQIIHANYKSRMLIERLQPGSDAATMHWSQLTPQLQTRLDLMLRPLVDALLMANAAPLPRPIAGSNGYAARFQSRGPRDPQGRSLRQLDLNTQVFRYPLSFLIYSEGFDALPTFVREHVYMKLAQILQAADPGAPYRSRSAADRKAALDILLATKPQFAREAASSTRG
jgi:hypothetical protein